VAYEEFKQKIDSAGQLATGETFTGIGDLKRIFAAEHKLEFYRCLTEKLLTYALDAAWNITMFQPWTKSSIPWTATTVLFQLY